MLHSKKILNNFFKPHNSTTNNIKLWNQHWELLGNLHTMLGTRGWTNKHPMFKIIFIGTQKGPCCIHWMIWNLSIVLTNLFYNIIQTWKQKNQPKPRKNGLHVAYKPHMPCDGKKST